jgi:hypothetical protein
LYLTEKNTKYEIQKQEIKRLGDPRFGVEFGGRMAAVAREETAGKYKTNWILGLDIYRQFLPVRAYGANSTAVATACSLLASYTPVHVHLRVTPCRRGFSVVRISSCLRALRVFVFRDI